MTRPILRLGDSGLHVTEWQTILNKNGFPVTVDGIYGPYTKSKTRLWQEKMGLVDDGIVGPISWGKGDPATAEVEGRHRSVPAVGYYEAVIKEAERLVGHREDKENSSSLIDQWLLDCGITWPAPWCMAFVQACFKYAAIKCEFKDPLKPDTAGVLDLYNRVPASWRVGPLDGRRGDIMIMDFGGGKGHTGIVTGYHGGQYYTIEGNTNAGGSRDGDCVADKKRNPYTKIKGFIRVPDPGAGVVS